MSKNIRVSGLVAKRQMMDWDGLYNLMASGGQKNLWSNYQRAVIRGSSEAKQRILDKISRIYFNDLQFSYSGCVLLTIEGVEPTPDSLSALRQVVQREGRTLFCCYNAYLRTLHWVCRYTLPDGTLPSADNLVRLFHQAIYVDAWQFYSALVAPLGVRLRVDSWEPLVSIPRPCDPEVFYRPDAEVQQMQQPLTPAERLEQGQELLSSVLDHQEVGVFRFVQGYQLFHLCLGHLLEQGYACGTSEHQEESLPLLARYCCEAGLPEEDAVRWTLGCLGLFQQRTLVSQIFRNAYMMACGRRSFLFNLHKEQIQVLKLNEFLHRRYRLRYNVMRRSNEYQEVRKSSLRYQPLTDRVLNSICLSAQEEGISVWDRDVKRYVHSERIPNHYPLEDYLSRLPAWDGVDYIGELGRRIPNEHPYWESLWHTWFLSMVAQWCGMNAEHGNSLTPQLIGDQGCGKSTFCRLLLPPELGDYYTDQIDWTSLRKLQMAMNRYALVSLDEFDSVSEGKQPLLKNLLQMVDLKTAPPYQSTDVKLKRYASFIGTSNQQDLLTDTSGSRRFICVLITGDIVQGPINYAQLYAQAMAELRRGEPYWLTREQEQKLMDYNRMFLSLNADEQLFLSTYQPTDEKDPAGEWLPCIEIHQQISKMSKRKMTDRSVRKMSRWLLKLGILRKRSNKGWLYRVKKLK